MKKIKIIECSRDAMQGVNTFIPTDKKVAYINQLLKVGYDIIDFGSFISPKDVPQMRDTSSVLNRINLEESTTELSVVVGDMQGAMNACDFDEIRYLAYPFSISETFQQKNTNNSIESSFEVIQQLQNFCEIHAKHLVIDVSMAFGNPYNDFYDKVILTHWIDRLVEEKVEFINILDTLGTATHQQVGEIMDEVIIDYPKTEFGIHLHTSSDNWKEKLAAAFNAGCERFDATVGGFGGCAMANNSLIGNLSTENLISFLDQEKAQHKVDIEELEITVNNHVDIFTN